MYACTSTISALQIFTLNQQWTDTITYTATSAGSSITDYQGYAGTSTTMVAFSTGVVNLPLIWVAYKKGELTGLDSSSTPQTSLAPSSPTQGGTAHSSPARSRGKGLSVSAKAGIGVSVAVIVLMLLAVILYFSLTRRKKTAVIKEVQEQWNKSELEDNPIDVHRNELPVPNNAHEVSGASSQSS